MLLSHFLICLWNSCWYAVWFPQLFDLEERRKQGMHRLAVIIQKIFRGWRQRTKVCTINVPFKTRGTGASLSTTHHQSFIFVFWKLGTEESQIDKPFFGFCWNLHYRKWPYPTRANYLWVIVFSIAEFSQRGRERAPIPNCSRSKSVAWFGASCRVTQEPNGDVWPANVPTPPCYSLFLTLFIFLFLSM